MKKTILLAVVAFLTTANVYSQTLEITAVEANEDRLYNSLSKNTLGKSMVLKVFDNAVSVRVGKSKPEILKETGENTYERVVKDTQTETETISLKINKVLALITSAEFKVVIRENKGDQRVAIGTLTAKRF